MSNEMKRSNCEIDLDLMESEYGDEIMCAGWNADVDLMCQQQLVQVSAQLAKPIDYGIVILEMCLKQMYSYRH